LQPFPGSGLFATDPLAGNQLMQLKMLGVMLPSLNRAREMANRVKSASNLRQIGQGILLYSNEHRGKYPATLGDLAITEDLGWQVFLMPQIYAPATPAPTRDNLKALAAWVNANSDYVYLGKGKTSASAKPDEVIAYEKHAPNAEGANALFGDGHVEWLTIPALNRKLEGGRAPGAGR
jgi:prepilin-type processing-associated H-X9-DG protein